MTKSSVSGSHSGTSKYNLWPLILQASASDFLVSFTTFTVMIRCSCLCSLAVSLGCLAQNIYKLSLSFLRTQNSSTNSFQDTKFVLEHDKKCRSVSATGNSTELDSSCSYIFPYSLCVSEAVTFQSPYSTLTFSKVA